MSSKKYPVFIAGCPNREIQEDIRLVSLVEIKLVVVLEKRLLKEKLTDGRRTTDR